MVSIIVPVYNAENYIETTIEMVRKQTYMDWELILVDDCSTDKSVEIIKKCIGNESDKIRLISKPVNEGAAMARNTGIDNARGRYIAFLDADDVWYRDKLLRQIAFMEKHEAAFVFSSYEFGDEDAKPTGKAVHVPKKLDYKSALSRTVIFTSTVLLDTKKIRKELIHMPSIGSEDTATWWRILKSGVTAYGLDEPLAIYRRPLKSLSSDKGVAVKRIWNLYRTVAGMSVVTSIGYMLSWAWRATVRRLVDDTLRKHAEAIKRVTTLELAMIGIILQTALFAYTWFYRYYPLINSYRVNQEGIDLGTGLKLYFRGHLLVLLIYFALLWFFTKLNDGMKTGYLKSGSIFTSQSTALLMTNVMIYFQMSLMRNWIVPIRYLAILTIVQIMFALVWSLISDRIYRRVFQPIEALAVVNGTSTVVQAFNSRQDRFQVVKVLDISDDINDIKEECLHWYGAVIIDSVDDNSRNELMEFCYSHHIRVYYLPEIQDILIQGSETMDLFNIPILELKEYSISWESRIIKRLADIVLSTVFIISTSPILLARALYGKLKYGRVVESETCVTKSKKNFQMHTFTKEGGDKTLIDKLPTLWDVLRGKMSMVGPKPCRLEEIEQIIKENPRYEYKFRVKAGLTGYAQVYGGASKDCEDLLKLDLIYIQNYSIMLDFRLLIFSIRK
jgi:glycosyltransferase involved in cell wall biosynthesis/lipopolysaccharide/colanic/teichoic acid biosynthesis glycosyltransferase